MTEAAPKPPATHHSELRQLRAARETASQAGAAEAAPLQLLRSMH